MHKIGYIILHKMTWQSRWGVLIGAINACAGGPFQSQVDTYSFCEYFCTQLCACSIFHLMHHEPKKSQATVPQDCVYCIILIVGKYAWKREYNNTQTLARRVGVMRKSELDYRGTVRSIMLGEILKSLFLEWPIMAVCV